MKQWRIDSMYLTQSLLLRATLDLAVNPSRPVWQ